ncbi:MAG: hypothetical protein ACJKSS_01035 [Patescibacteria group bacterium UBA2103]
MKKARGGLVLFLSKEGKIQDRIYFPAPDSIYIEQIKAECRKHKDAAKAVVLGTPGVLWFRLYLHKTA